MKHITLPDFLTETEIEQATALWRKLGTGAAFVGAVEASIIVPNMDRINAALGQENNARYLAYAVDYVFSQAGATRES
jgi:hypothetical protein